MNKLKKIFNYIFRLKTSRLLLAFMHNGYLLETGWLKHFNQKAPLDKDGHPIPWTSYSFIPFINDYLTKEMNVFEYGSGNSTIYYAARAKHVYTIEHNKDWHEHLKDTLPSNTSLFNCPLTENYEKSIELPEIKFDVIIVDGRRRNNCIREAINYIKEDGIIVLDDSERETYKEGIGFLSENGFKKIDFWGISHRYFHNKATSIFFKHL
jgi:precorrin-6B methylase 2